jgi:AraC-like DNA-binding protein
VGRHSTDLDFTFRLVPLIVRWLEARGLNAAARDRLLQSLPGGAATAAEITAPLTTIQQFLDAADLAGRESSLGLALASAVPRGTYAWIEFIARLSATLKDGMNAVGRYYRLLNKGAEISYFERGERAGIEIRVAGREDGWGRHLNEYTIALFDRVTRELMPEWRPTRVWFSHPAPDWAAIQALAERFGVTPVFGEPTCGFEGPLELALAPLRTGDLTLQRLLESQAAEALAQRQPLDGLASRVRDLLGNRLGQADVGVEAIARELGLTARTLQRRLKEEGRSFQDLLDGAREQFAKGYLSRHTFGVSEVAYLLGYTKLRAFDRAFRRWTGKTPTAWRAALQCAKPGHPAV